MLSFIMINLPVILAVILSFNVSIQSGPSDDFNRKYGLLMIQLSTSFLEKMILSQSLLSR